MATAPASTNGKREVIIEARDIVVESADRYKFMRWHKSY